MWSSRNRVTLCGVAVIPLFVGAYLVGARLLATGLASQYMMVADRAQQTGQIPKAIANCESALRSDPKYHPARDLLANIYESIGMRAQAYAERRKGVRLDPNNPEPHRMLSAALIVDHQYKAAIQHLRSAVHLDRAEPLTHLMLAHCYVKIGHWAQAREQYRIVLSSDPHQLAATVGLRRVEARLASPAPSVIPTAPAARR